MARSFMNSKWPGVDISRRQPAGVGRTVHHGVLCLPDTVVDDAACRKTFVSIYCLFKSDFPCEWLFLARDEIVHSSKPVHLMIYSSFTSPRSPLRDCPFPLFAPKLRAFPTQARNTVSVISEERV